VLAGGTYALVRGDVAALAGRALPRQRHIVVALGGADPLQLTAEVVRRVIAAKLPDCLVTAVVGPSNPGRASVEAAAAGSPLVSVVQDPPDFSWLLAQSSLVITAAGTTGWELAALGVPSILLVVADNQQRGASAIHEAVAAEVLDARTAIDLEPLTEVVRSLWTDRDRCAAMAQRATRIIDARGAARVARWMMEGAQPGAITVRPAVAQDALQVWRINSELSVRTRSFDPAPIHLARHFEWFDRLLASGTSRMYVLAREDEIAAQIRYDRVDDGRVELSFAVASPYRRLGLGTRLLTDTWELACRDLDVTEVRGLVMRDNVPSLDAFRRAGFVEAGFETRAGRDCVVFSRRAA
jgi:RimJ/RimL family protein N-acetyltransferase